MAMVVKEEDGFYFDDGIQFSRVFKDIIQDFSAYIKCGTSKIKQQKCLLLTAVHHFGVCYSYHQQTLNIFLV